LRSATTPWLLLLSLACAAPTGPRADLSGTPAMKRELLCGLQNQSTAPSYVLLDVQPAGLSGWRGVVESSEVARAIALDRGWPGPSGHWDVILALLAQADALAPEPVTREAQAALRPLYSPDELDQARRHLARFSDDRVREELSDPSAPGPIRPFYAESALHFLPRQAALAHALIERGFLPERGDYAPVLRIVESNCERVR